MSEHQIFILDDEADIGEFVANAARLNGFESAYFSDPEAFMAALSASTGACAAIDLQMPQLDGIEVLRRLSNLRFARPIVIMSGMDLKVLESARHFAKANNLSVSDIAAKPLRLEELSRIFARLKVHARLPPTRSEILQAMAEGEFSLHLQPKVLLQGRRDTAHPFVPMGFEGLARWTSPTKGLINPDVFIPQIMDQGLGAQFSDHVFDLALAILEQWKRQGIEATLAINMSATDVEDLSLADRLWSRCAGTGVDHRRITIEITETDAMRHPATALDVLMRLRLRGFLLSIDDFGTGYSSLVQLQRLPFGELKIDRSIIADCSYSEQARIIVKAIIDLAHSLGLHVVAEGVEDLETLELLRSWSCDLLQGYVVSRPLRADLAAKWWLDRLELTH